MVYHVQFPGLGLDLTVNRVALAIGGFNIYWYGVIIAAGMLLAQLGMALWLPDLGSIVLWLAVLLTIGVLGA